jgi:uncharacterized ubiquitin-like protein YukD
VQCELDVISHDHGHIVVRLLLYHCQYNFIELVWAQVKLEMADENTAFRLSNVATLMNSAIKKYYKSV